MKTHTSPSSPTRPSSPSPSPVSDDATQRPPHAASGDTGHAELQGVLAGLPKRPESSGSQRTPRGMPDMPTSHGAEVRPLLPEIVRHIANYMDHPTRVNWAIAYPRGVEPHIRAELRARTIAMRDAPRMKSLSEFRALLGPGEGSVLNLPAKLQGEPLAALGENLRRLSWEDRGPAFDALSEAWSNHAGPTSGATDKLRRIIQAGPASLEMKEREARVGPAGREVLDGANVQDTASKHFISTPSEVVALELMTASQNGPAYVDVQSDGKFRRTAEKFGLRSTEAIARLNLAAALVAARAPDFDLGKVAGQYEISARRELRMLRAEAARWQ